MFFLFTETAEYLCIFQSKPLHLTKTHNSEDCFILLLREFLGFFPQKMSAMLCFFCSFFSFFLYRKNLSQLLPLLFHWTENSLAFRCILYYAECFLLHWENILNLCFKLCHLFFWGEAPLHKMKNLIYFKISKGYFCPWYYYKFYLCSRLFPHTFTSLTLLKAIRSQLQTWISSTCLTWALLSLQLSLSLTKHWLVHLCTA